MGDNGEAAHVFVSQPATAGDLKRLLCAMLLRPLAIAAFFYLIVKTTTVI